MTKIFYGNQFVGRFNCDGRKYTKFQVFKMKTKVFIKRLVVVSSFVSALGWAYVAGAYHSPVTIQADAQVVKVPIAMSINDFPMLVRICNAESSGIQFKKNGDVVRGLVNPSDIGICQINEPINNDQARKLGYDIYTKKGNEDMAIWLFTNFGTSPWNSSKCIKNGWGTKAQCK